MYAYKESVKVFNEWKALLDDVNLNNSQENIERVANIFVDQVHKEEEFMKNGEVDKIGDCTYHIPKIDCLIDKVTGIGRAIANKFFPLSDEDKVDPAKRKYQYIQYNQRILVLKRVFLNRLKVIEDERLKSDRLKKAEKLQARRGQFCTLKKKAISDQILKPTAMPVQVSDIEDLEPFFSYVSNNGKVCGRAEFSKGAYHSDSVDLCKQVVGPWVENLIKSLENNVHVKHFLLGNNIIGDSVEHIAKFISENHVAKIKTWYLAGNKIDGNNVKALAIALAQDTYAQSLWLKRNPIGVDGAQHLANMLQINKCMKILDLHNTCMLDEGTRAIFDALKSNTTLRIIYLDANGITPIGASYIADYFNYMGASKRKGITSIWLDMNRLDDEGASIISSAAKNYPYLKRLVLGSNRISSNGAKIVFDNLKGHPNLFLLDLGLYKSTFDMGELPNNIGDEGVPHIIEYLNNNPTIKIFSIEQNNISKSGMDMIANSISDNTTLLKFSHKQYDSEGPFYSKQIKDIIDANCAANNYPDLRFITHTKKVRHIDSIYRNNM